MPRGARIWIGLAAALGILFLVFVLFLRVDTRSFHARAESMAPTININERFTINEEAYDSAEPERRDIVVLHPPKGASGDGGPQCGGSVGPRELCPAPIEGATDVLFVKRVIGLPGDRLRIRDGRALVDGKPLDEPYAQRCGGDGCSFRGEITVPDGHFYVMGDNRGASDDSRFWGPVPREQIVGRVDDCLPLGLRCTEKDFRDSG